MSLMQRDFVCVKDVRAFGIRSLVASFVVITICEGFFLLDVFSDVFHVDISAPWIEHNVLELITSGTLALALIAIGWQIWRLLQENRETRNAVQAASGELLKVIYAKFDSWKLSPSESEIALLLIKGLSIQEISDLRNTRPGTVKSQGSAIYRKAGVAGRHELMAYFVEDLLAGEAILPVQDRASETAG